MGKIVLAELSKDQGVQRQEDDSEAKEDSEKFYLPEIPLTNRNIGGAGGEEPDRLGINEIEEIPWLH